MTENNLADEESSGGCADYMRNLLPVLNEEATPAVVAAVTSHAEACAACGRIWEIAHNSSCKEIADFLDDYIDGSLPLEKREVFDRHMSVCPECIAYLANYRDTIELVKESGRGDEPPLPAALVAAILDAQRRDGN